jgi:hypothetical protein
MLCYIFGCYISVPEVFGCYIFGCYIRVPEVFGCYISLHSARSACKLGRARPYQPHVPWVARSPGESARERVLLVISITGFTIHCSNKHTRWVSGWAGATVTLSLNGGRVRESLLGIMIFQKGGNHDIP